MVEWLYIRGCLEDDVIAFVANSSPLLHGNNPNVTMQLAVILQAIYANSLTASP